VGRWQLVWTRKPGWGVDSWFERGRL